MIERAALCLSGSKLTGNSLTGPLSSDFTGLCSTIPFNQVTSTNCMILSQSSSRPAQIPAAGCFNRSEMIAALMVHLWNEIYGCCKVSNVPKEEPDISGVVIGGNLAWILEPLIGSIMSQLPRHDLWRNLCSLCISLWNRTTQYTNI